MSDLIKTTVLKPHMGSDGIITKVGQQIEVDEQRHKALAKKGFVSSETEQVADARPKPVKDAITNADFEGRRTPISGSGMTAPKQPADPSSKGTAKRKAKSA
ncbi:MULTISPECIES: hypothetical protein [unclassified Mesorhizobium]|uniref:hypothetical protein n=1 Tax=unclassified Mesorhizobium TaxID=325217 RepID=UPI00112D5170|nr:MULTISPECIES: hypothetical protein [unclassified Mesorhizobium]MCA0025479.1 hypothetical protein [Mesorhizobium sp. B263B1A]TPJ97133.1 hypothetical protein FJ489_11890 [Mesorhizobium sp. B2-5-12]TPK27200.1 hypothetical protein FJ562_08135 [Mesorhizobium sp. B2-5-6]